MQVEEISQADDQLIDGLRVYELMLEENDDGSKDDDPAKMYSTGEKIFDEPTSTVEEPTKEINLGMKDDPQTIIISLNLNRDTGSPQIPEDVGKSSQSSVKESSKSSPSSPSNPF